MEEKDYLDAKKAHEISANVSHINEVMRVIQARCEKGFFFAQFPEMAESDLFILKELGYKWVKSSGFIEIRW